MFSLKLALQSIFKEKLINFISMLSLSIGLFILFVIFLSVYNVERLTDRLPGRFSVMIYLKDYVTEKNIDRIESLLQKDPLVNNIKFISKKQALDDLKNTLKDTYYIFEGLNENPLSDSFDVRLKHGSFSINTVNNFIKKFGEMKEVDDIIYGEKFLESIYSIKNGVKLLGLLITVFFTAAIIFICYSTVKVLFFRHGEEIEIYKLLGATKNLIRSPFLIEGFIIGFIGGILCTLVLFLIDYFLLNRLVLTIPLLSSLILPLPVLYIPPLLGSFLGFSGAAIALGRIRY